MSSAGLIMFYVRNIAKIITIGFFFYILNLVKIVCRQLYSTSRLNNFLLQFLLITFVTGFFFLTYEVHNLTDVSILYCFAFH